MVEEKIKIKGVQLKLDKTSSLALTKLQELLIKEGFNSRSLGSINSILSSIVNENIVDYYTELKEYYSQVR